MKGEVFVKDIAAYIDHTLLKPQTTKMDVKKLCQEAVQYHFASVCINPKFVRYASELLKGSSVKVCTVIGFPLGANKSEIKAYEAKMAIHDGAGEVDMVIDIGAVKEHDYSRVKDDIVQVKAVVDKDHMLKVIIETCLLTEEEIIKTCLVCREAEADFVKTSTGFSSGGATPEDVKLMYETVGPEVKVKASGGIRNRIDAERMIANGASRLGTSAGIIIADSGQ